MAKRFTDNQKWSKSWFMDLEIEDKLLWIYMTDSCNHAGIWEVNWKLTSFMVGFQVAKLPDSFEKQVYKINEKKYFIKDFIDFQYGKLVENNNAHKSVIAILNKYNINSGASQPLVSPSQGVKDKDKDKDKVKVKDKDKDKVKNFKKPIIEECVDYFKKMKYPDYKNQAEKFFYFYESKGWMVGKNKMKNWHMASGSWNKNNTNNYNSVVDFGDEKIKKERNQFLKKHREIEKRSASTEEVKDILQAFSKRVVDS